jgi:hypothetical protein
MKSLTPRHLKVSFGPEAVTYTSGPASSYEEQVQVLRLDARALSGAGGGIVDYFKPICSE